jgi:hypothetical protein
MVSSFWRHFCVNRERVSKSRRTTSRITIKVALEYGATTNGPTQTSSARLSSQENHAGTCTSKKPRRVSSFDPAYSVPRRPSGSTFHRLDVANHHGRETNNPSDRQCLSRMSQRISSVRSDDTEDSNDSNEMDVNVTKFFDTSTTTLQKIQLITCHNFDAQSRSIYKLGGPFMLQALMAAASALIRLALVGHRLGTSALSAFVIVDLLVMLTSDCMRSILLAGNTLIAQVSETDNSSFKAGRYLQLSLILFVIGSLPVIIMWSCYMDRLLIFFGFDEDIAEIGRLFVIPYSVAELFAGISIGLQYMLDGKK